MKPLISIIIPTYNRAHLIGETLDSVIAQTYENWECIVVDDGSSDYTTELMEYYCEKDDRIQFYQRPIYKEKGANACRNSGLTLCQGDFIMFLDSDDVLVVTCLISRLEVVLLNLDHEVYIFTMERFSEFPGDTDEIVNKPVNSHFLALQMFLQHELPWPISSLLIKKSLRYLSFKEDLKRLQDVAYSINLLLHIYPHQIFFSQTQPDCYYRNAKKGGYSVSFLNVLVESVEIYFIYIDDLLKKNCDSFSYSKNKKYHFRFAIFFYSEYFLLNISKVNSLSRIKSTLLLRKYITRRDILKMSYIEFLYEKKIEKNGLGFYRIMKEWKRREFYS